MGLFAELLKYLTEGGKKEGLRLFEGKSGSYIKKNGNGRKGKTIFFKRK